MKYIVKSVVCPHNLYIPDLLNPKEAFNISEALFVDSSERI